MKLLQQIIQYGVTTEKHILFWGNWPSNFAWAPIKVTCVDGIERRFFSSEQYFMYEKAIHFGDTTSFYNKI